MEKEIDSLENNIVELENILKNQVVFAYKYKRGKHLDWILGSANFNDLLVRWHYLQKVSLAETNVMAELKTSQSELALKEDKIKSDILSLNDYLVAARDENINLKTKRKTHSKIVSDVTRNKTLLSASLKEKKESYRKLTNLIASLEKGRPSRQLKAENQLKWEKLSGSFSKNKGRLNWPVQGTVLHGYGKFKNPILKTVLNNTGIDIRADLGDDVRCIFSGVVSLITYMSGFGNMVIVDHNDSYYTVYAHLDQILVNSGDFLEDGEVIGTVGESGSLEGPKLQLEIYGLNKTENPETWLQKK
ncbi:MAG: peptidoglycan DD-metalloendopeptidase family protein [Calditrichota bacterium]